SKRRLGIGFGLSLVAESSAVGILYSADVVVPSSGGVVPEDIGKQCAYQLLENISQGGCATQVSASNNARMIHSAREILNPLVSDIHIAAQYDQAPLVSTGDKAGSKRRLGIGFGLSLVAESSAVGILYSADV
ncbi:hypothetical protein ACHAPQ_012649, partial [Fusarium lateritium]